MVPVHADVWPHSTVRLLIMNTGLYIHIPFCRSKCIYCDFYSTPAMGAMERVVEGIIAEYGYRRDEIAAPFQTVYIGGGTPSVLPANLFSRLIDTIDLTGVEEFTIEVNPEDVTTESVAFWRSLGVNRISMGVQSLRDPILTFIGRRHSANQAIAAIDLLSQGGIANVSVDLIYGLPGLSVDDWKEDLRRVLSMPVTHMSAYCLSWYEGTRLHKMWRQGRTEPVDDDIIDGQFSALQQIAAQHGFEHYEISNLARPGFQSRHNTAYWNPDSQWLGLGPSAHSFDGNLRRIDDSRISSWLHRLPYPCDIDEEDAIDRLNDNIVTALRTSHGLDLSKIPSKYKKQIIADAKPSLRAGHIELSDDHLRIPAHHWLTSDTIIRQLIVLH